MKSSIVIITKYFTSKSGAGKISAHDCQEHRICLPYPSHGFDDPHAMTAKALLGKLGFPPPYSFSWVGNTTSGKVFVVQFEF